MSKKILVICGSPRVDSHSDVLAKAFATGAQEGGNVVEVIKLTEKNIAACSGCAACRKSANNDCILNDDMQGLYKQVIEADIFAFATPLYFLTVSAQLKAFIDRLYCLHHSRKIRDKKCVLITTSGGLGSDVFIDYFTALCNLLGWENAGIVSHGGLGGASSAVPCEEIKKEAYELGINL